MLPGTHFYPWFSYSWHRRFIPGIIVIPGIVYPSFQEPAPDLVNTKTTILSESVKGRRYIPRRVVCLDIYPPLFTFPSGYSCIIDQFRYIEIQPKTIYFNAKLLGINPSNSVVIPMSLVLRSIVLS